MDKKVAVESSLKDYIDFLERCGYQVDRIDQARDANRVQGFDYDAVVVSSISNSSMESTSFEKTSSRPSAPIVEAEGKTPEEVFNILRARY